MTEINIGGIKVTFGADSRPLEEGGARVEASLKKAELAANAVKAAVGWMAGFAGAAAFGREIGQAVGRLENMAKMAREVDRALQVTGNVANTTSRELIKYAEELEKTTGRAAEEIVDLGANLASFGFTHEVFYRSIDLANDMSAAWGGDLKQNLEGLARALDDPINGMAMLSKRGIKLTEDQKNLVQELINANDHLGAQGVVFEALEAQVNGVAEAGFAGLTRAMAETNEASENFFETLIQSVDLPHQLEMGLNTATAALGFLSDNMDTIIPLVTAVSTAIGVLLVPAVTGATLGFTKMAAAMLLSPVGILAVSIGALVGYLVMLDKEQNAAAEAARLHEQAIGENANAIEIAKTSSAGFREQLKSQISMQLKAAEAALAEANAQNAASQARSANIVAASNDLRDWLRQGMGMEPVGDMATPGPWNDRETPHPLQDKVDAAEKVIADLKAQAEELNTIISTIPPTETPYTSSAQADDSGARSAEKLAEQSEKRLEVLRTSLLTEEQTELESYNNKLTALQEFLANKEITQEQFDSMRERLQTQHEGKLTEITRQQQELRDRIQRESISRVASTLDAIGNVLQQSGEEQFGVVKAISVASALLKGYESVVSSYAAGTAIGGPPVGFAFAALAAATTAAQIAQLMSVGPTSSGSPSAGGGSSTPSVPANSQGGANYSTGNSEERRLIEVRGLTPGQMYDGESMRYLIGALRDAQKDGWEIML